MSAVTVIFLVLSMLVSLASSAMAGIALGVQYTKDEEARKSNRELLRRVMRELSLPMAVVSFLAGVFGILAGAGIASFFYFVVAAMIAWFIYIDKDNHWRKRGKRLASKVKEVAGRLVIVAVPAPARA
jgi:uncharacterized membrane protein